jgi:predicted 3-demethylubiquinone-9 3-methyltransferase (glyoxalase superfamily)
MEAQKITPSLWFDTNTEEAINYYVEVFNGSPAKRAGSRIVSIQRYEKGMETPGMPDMEGKILTAVFELAGQRFMALDGGPYFTFNEAISLLIDCEDQAEVDYFWERLSAVPEAEQCGWVKDRFGLSWQIIPRRMTELLGHEDRTKALAATNAMLKMKKIDVAELERAFENAS